MSDGPDFRAAMAPRFKGDAFDNNLALVDEIRRVGAQVDATPGQVALAWVLQRDDGIVTIPGTTKLANLKSNLRAAELRLPPAAVTKLDALASKVKGERYDEAGMKTVNG